jgi:hypothetical protein
LTRCDGDLVEAWREQDKSLEVSAAHGPSLVREQRLVGVVLGFNQNMAVVVLERGFSVALSGHQDASLIHLGHSSVLAGLEVVQFNHGQGNGPCRDQIDGRKKVCSDEA